MLAANADELKEIGINIKYLMRVLDMDTKTQLLQNTSFGLYNLVFEIYVILVKH